MRSTMTGSELNSTREALGFSVERLAHILDVDPATIRKWEMGKHPIPDGVAEDLRNLEEEADAIVAETIALLTPEPGEDPEPLIIWRGATADAAMRADGHPWEHRGARWWRTIAYRAARQVPGARLATYAEARDLEPDA